MSIPQLASRLWRLALLLGLLSLPAWAATTLSEAQLDARTQHLASELRCLVCQNETLADSTAPLAQDLKMEIRQMMAQQQSDAQITDYLVARYGDFVCYRPPLKATTWLLWLGPFFMLLVAVVTLAILVRQRKHGVDELALTAEQQAQARQWLSQD